MLIPHPLPKTNRTKVIGSLNSLLADSTAIQGNAKQAHWNVKGPRFKMLHVLFDDVYEAAGEWSDSIAERAVQLDGQALGTIQEAARNTVLPQFPLLENDENKMITEIAHNLQTFSQKLYAAMHTIEVDNNDPTTSNMLASISESVDKLLWFVKSHLQ